MSQPDPLDEISDALRGSLVNIKMALRLIGEIRAGKQTEEKAEQEAGPRMFGKKAPARPTTAVKAESHESEGLDNAG